jgi:serine protease AprX
MASQPRRVRRAASTLALALLAGLLSAGPASAATGPRVDAHLVDQLKGLADDATHRALVHFDGGSDAAHAAFVKSQGLEVGSHFESIDVILATGSSGALRGLFDASEVSYLQADRQLHYHGDTAAWATRARVAYEDAAKGPYLDGSGNPVDGRGVGVAVVDSGVYGMHPDLENRLAGNFKFVCPTVFTRAVDGYCYPVGTIARVDNVPTSDTTGGHGTHVAGIVAGDGTASDGFYRGAAPGASLYGFGAGETLFVSAALESFEFIRDNYDDPEFFPVPIKVINNSWGDSDDDPTTPSPVYEPNDAVIKLSNDLIGLGVTMVWSAGNSGGSPAHDNTSSYCKNPTPGNICVANYDDLDMGSRTAALDASSSRGLAGNQFTYPDISAPGTNIISTCAPHLPVCHIHQAAFLPNVSWAPHYAPLNGTSMASPHVAGIAALLLQARPDLTPAAVEDTLLDSALKFGGAYESDSQNLGGTTSVDRGAGLADLPAALKALSVGSSGTLPEVGSDQHIASDPEDPSLPGVNDVLSLDAREEADGVSYIVRLRNAADRVPGINNLFILDQNVDGKKFTTWIRVNSSGATPLNDPEPGVDGNADATSAAINNATNRLTFFVPFTALGDPPDLTPAHNVFLQSWFGTQVDIAPGGVSNEKLLGFPDRGGRELELFPVSGDPYTIVRDGGVRALETTTTITSAASAQYGDGATVSARVTDTNGAPAVDVPVTFNLAGVEAGSRTNDSGVAAVDLPIAATTPGTYELQASFAGVDGKYLASGATRAFDITKEAVSVSFTATSPNSGHYSDTTTLSATLTDDDGQTVPGQPISFTIAGITGEGQTDGQGVANDDLVLGIRPTSTTASAAFAGSDLYEAAQTSAGFDVLKEVTTLSLNVTGKAGKRQLTATLLDDEGIPVVGRVVTFFANGQRMGIEETVSNGQATFTPAKEFQGKNVTYTARFAGDDHFQAS